MIRQFLIITALAALAGCSSSKKSGTAKNDKARQAIACAEQQLSGNHLDWHIIDTSTVTFPKGMRMPAGYKIYTLDSAQLATFFSRPSDTWRTALPLPEPVGCQVVTLKESAAMSEDLKKKFPNNVSLQGKGDGNPQSDIRLDYDGKRVRGMVRWGADQYIINPVMNGSTLYYMVFNKQASNLPKRPFEQRSNQSKKLPAYDK